MIFYKTSDIALVYFDKILKWLSLEIIKPWVLSGLVYTYLKTVSKANIELIFIHITEGKNSIICGINILLVSFRVNDFLVLHNNLSYN